MLVTPGDIDYGWRTIKMEAANQGFQGMLAVAWVIRNRMEFKTGDRWATLAQTCLDWLQFSGWREQDATFKPTLSADLDDIGLLCLRALVTALTGSKTDDPTHGARHYFNPNVCNPDWAKGKNPCAVIGDHRFYNNIA